MLPLADNYGEDEFEYELHVQTGSMRGAATKSNIYFRLYGTHSETGVRRLDDQIRQVGLRAYQSINQSVRQTEV